MEKGRFITFEGIDGCGKTTQINMLKEMLEKEGYETVITKEPGAGEFGEQIRNIVLHNKGFICDKAEMFLFLADRAQHIETIIKPAINEGKIVLCDRHTDSTLAYQGFGRGADTELLKQLNSVAVSGIVPDLTLLYDISVDTSEKRVGKEKDRMESVGNGFAEKVREGYIRIAEENSERIKMIDGEKSINDVFEETKKHINNLLKKKTEV